MKSEVESRLTQIDKNTWKNHMTWDLTEILVKKNVKEKKRKKLQLKKYEKLA